MPLKTILLELLLLSLLLLPAATFAGPPFRTDDPEPVPYQHLEFYVFSQATRSNNDTVGSFPGLDLNYGIVPETHIHLSVQIAYDDNLLSRGAGDMEIGAKHRFIKEDANGWLPQISCYPQLELPTGDSNKGLGTGHQRLFLPLWLQKSFDDWTTFGGGGYWVNSGIGNINYWYWGWTLLRKITDQLSLGTEIFYQTADTTSNVNSSGFNLGGIYNFTEIHHLLFSAGSGVLNAATTNQFSYYIAYQFTN